MGDNPVTASAVAYEKYSLLGNTFLLVDEAVTPLRDDGERSAFARWALDGYFGIGGADNVVYLDRGAGAGSPYRFRIFEYDGAETLSCGNGLLSAAALLARVSPASEWRMLTELPTGRPREVRIGYARDAGLAWVGVGQPRPLPDELYAGPRGAGGPAQRVSGLVVGLPRELAWERGLPPSLDLAGWLVFTGEPHLVVLVGDALPRGCGAVLFPDRPEDMACGNALVDHLGRELNTRYRALFPAGVHLNVAQVCGHDIVRYRTWERAIDRETLACGTGALAVAHVCATLRLTSPARTTLLPHRCRAHRPGAELHVSETGDGLVLEGRPTHACSGVVPGRVARRAADRELVTALLNPPREPSLT